MATEILATAPLQTIADRIIHAGVTLDGVVAFLEEQVQSEDMHTSRLSFTLAETVKNCIRDLEANARQLRDMPL